MQKKAEPNITQMFDSIVLLQTLQTLEAYQTFCYNLYLLLTHDTQSRPLTKTYPNNYKVTNHYNYGMVDRVTGSDGKVHYQIESLNAFGDISSASFANGVKTKMLHDGARYTGTIVSGQGMAVLGDVQRLDYTYDRLGNVLEREDTSIDGKYWENNHK